MIISDKNIIKTAISGKDTGLGKYILKANAATKSSSIRIILFFNGIECIVVSNTWFPTGKQKTGVHFCLPE
jgi:hypothetical protein